MLVRAGTQLRVACVLPLRGHGVFVDNAVRQFVEQSHPNRALVVVSPRGGLPNCPAREGLDLARVWTLTQTVPWPELPAALLRRAAELADADAATWWLPFDSMSPNRLSRQVTLLGDAVAVAATDTLVYEAESGAAFEGSGPTPGTLMLRRDAAEGAELTPALDPDPDWYLTVRIGNTRHSPPCRVPRPLSDATARLGDARGVYARWRNGIRTPAPVRPRSWSARPLNVAVPLLVFDGFGSMGEYLVRGLSRSLPISVTALALHRDGLHPETLRVLDRSDPTPSDPTLALCWVGTPFGRFASARPLFVNTMWESTQLPAGFAANLNRTRAVIVPSTWVARTFRENGVNVPIEVVPQGVDPERYQRLDRPLRVAGRGLTTLVVAAVTPRKNVGECVEGWRAAFADDPDARLVIKSRFGWRPELPDDPRITVVDSNEVTPGIRHWYARADAVLALGGEGFGLPLLEAMACGLPVVALDAQGQHDTVAAAPGCLLPVPAAAWVPYDDGTYAVGLRAVPDVPAVADALTWVASHPEEARAMGRRASDWVHRNRDIWDMAPRMVDAMRRHLHDGEELMLADPAGQFPRETRRGTDPAFLAAH